MSDVPLISVIMPIYNTPEAYLREAVESVLNQTLGDFELLAVDNASDAYVAEVMKSFDDKRIRFFRLEKNQGPAGARSYALKQARGEFVAILDSDDVRLPESFAREAAFLQQNPEVIVVGSYFTQIPEGQLFKPKTDRKWLRAFALFVYCPFMMSSTMIRRRVLSENGLNWDKTMVPAEDYDLWVRLSLLGEFDNLPENLALYRWHGGNISITRHEAQVEKAMMAKVRAWENVFGLSAEQSRNLGQLFLRKSLAAGELVSAESGLLKIIAGVKENPLIDWPTAQKIILHQYRKAVRRQPNSQNVRRMLKSPLCRELGVSTFFRAEKYIGSFFKRERKRL